MKRAKRNLDDDGILGDGDVVRVPVFLMDALQREVAGMTLDAHRPGYRFLAGAAALDRREAAYREYDWRLADAWKSRQRQAQDAAIDIEICAAPPGTDRLAAAYDEYDKRIANAWKAP